MSFDLLIEGFQSLSEVALSIEEGLNVVIGKTNSGKSAIMRALEDAVFNDGEDSNVRKGKRYSKVTIKNDNGNEVYWQRDSQGKNEKTLYQFNKGNPSTKVGRSQLEEVISLLNITDVKMAREKVKVNFWYQGALPFLMDKTEKQLFEFISLSSSDNYIKVLKAIKSDSSSYRESITKLTAGIDVLRNINEEKKFFLEANEGYDDLYTRALQLDSAVQKYNKMDGVVDRIKSSKTKYSMRVDALAEIESQIGAIDFDTVKKEYIECATLSDERAEIGKVLVSLQDKDSNYRKLSTQLNVVSVKFKSLNDGLVSISSLYDSYVKDFSDYSEMKLIVDKLYEGDAKLKALKIKLSEVSVQADNIDIGGFQVELTTLNNLILDHAKMKEVVTKARNTQGRYTEKVKELAQVEKEYKEAELEFIKFKEETGSCPYCGGIFS